MSGGIATGAAAPWIRERIAKSVVTTDYAVVDVVSVGVSRTRKMTPRQRRFVRVLP